MARSPTKSAPAAAPRIDTPAPQQDFVPRDGRAVVMGRDGKPLYRGVAPGQVNGGHDVFSQAALYQPPGYVYEWKRYATMNAPDYTYQAQIQRVGAWAPVQNDRHPGVWLPPDHKGAIIIDGLILMERPIELHMEAKGEAQREADSRVQRAKTERGLAAASSGIDTNTPAARNASYVREGRLLDGNVGKDGLTDADAIRAARPVYDRQTVD